MATSRRPSLQEAEGTPTEIKTLTCRPSWDELYARHGPQHELAEAKRLVGVLQNILDLTYRRVRVVAVDRLPAATTTGTLEVLNETEAVITLSRQHVEAWSVTVFHEMLHLVVQSTLKIESPADEELLVTRLENLWHVMEI